MLKGFNEFKNVWEWNDYYMNEYQKDMKDSETMPEDYKETEEELAEYYKGAIIRSELNLEDF